MISYAGIGSRKITEQEERLIQKIAGKLSDSGFILYSGNAEGSDIAFQIGSNGNCVLMLPWHGFNKNRYNIQKSISYINGGETSEGQASVDKYHPAPKALTHGGRAMMARNYHQIMGFEKVYKAVSFNPTEIGEFTYPPVSFVVCCADRDKNGNVLGGTGQAVRIALDKGIPVFNIRDREWEKGFVEFLNRRKYENNTKT